MEVEEMQKQVQDAIDSLREMMKKKDEAEKADLQISKFEKSAD